MPLTKIQSLGITDGTIAAADIASGAITAAKLASGVGGKVLQVITATDTTQRSTTSTTFVTASSTLSINITPSSASNKIFIIYNTYAYATIGSILTTIFRDSTNVANSNGLGRFGTGGGTLDGHICTSFLDSPSTTSSINYTVRFKANTTATAYIGDNTETSTLTAFEIAG
jgi:hypothetical protein